MKIFLMVILFFTCNIKVFGETNYKLDASNTRFNHRFWSFEKNKVLIYDQKQNSEILYLREIDAKNLQFEAEVLFTEYNSCIVFLGRLVNDLIYYQYQICNKSLNKNSNELSLMYGGEGGSKKIASAVVTDKDLPINKWLPVKFIMNVNFIQGYLNGIMKLNVTDSRYTEPGKVGIKVLSTNKVIFRNIKVKVQ